MSVGRKKFVRGRNDFEPGERLVEPVLVLELGRAGFAGFLRMDMNRSTRRGRERESKEDEEDAQI